MAERLWITWENQRRNRTLSSHVDAKLYEMDLDAPWWVRYPVVVLKTIVIVIKENPRFIFSQNPSLVLALLSVLIASISRKKLIIDSHNAGLFPLEGKSKALNWISSKVCEWTDLTIVSNPDLKNYVESKGGQAIVIPDPIPDIEYPSDGIRLGGGFNILYVCSWAPDEPYYEVIKAAALLEDDCRIYISGDYKGRLGELDIPLPDNIELTGYIPDEQYVRYLAACDAVMALTQRENCLLCGAYEGVAAGKPVIITDTQALREYFSSGCIYTENNAAAIAAAIRKIMPRHLILSKDIHDFEALCRENTAEHIKNLEKYMNEM